MALPEEVTIRLNNNSNVRFQFALRPDFTFIAANTSHIIFVQVQSHILRNVTCGLIWLSRNNSISQARTLWTCPVN